MIIAKLHYTASLDQIDAHLIPHRKLLEDLCANGTVICSGPQNPRTGGIIMLNVPDKAAAEKILSNDPFWQHNLATYELIDFTPVKCAPEFMVFIKS